MESVTNGLAMHNVLVLVLISAVVSGTVFVAVFGWFRREQRRMQTKILEAIARAGTERDELLVLTGREARDCGELVARFKVNKGRHVVSVLEADGRRFIHVDGELSSRERERMLRYLKSEGFVA
jgi:hypothetical protein